MFPDSTTSSENLAYRINYPGSYSPDSVMAINQQKLDNRSDNFSGNDHPSYIANQYHSEIEFLPDNTYPSSDNYPILMGHSDPYHDSMSYKAGVSWKSDPETILHAPIPFPVSAPQLYSSLQTQAFYSSSEPCSEYHTCTVSSAVIDPQENIINEKLQGAAHAESVLTTTFPTPSELLSEITAKESVDTENLPLERRTDNARKARRRAMTQSIGFPPTDPDSISSHEKKRHYLECLEQYVIYLHKQLALVNTTPVALERVASYRGLSSRSIRTLLVHMENETRKLNQRTVEEEQRFISLCETVYKSDPTTPGAVEGAQRYENIYYTNGFASSESNNFQGLPVDYATSF